MKTSNWMKGFAAIAGSAVIGLIFVTIAHAAIPEPVVAEVEFADLITVTEVTPLRYGILDEALANAETVIISPDAPATVTDAGGNVLGGVQAAADLTVTATASETLSIQVDNITNNTGYTLGSFTCSYNDGANTACQAAPYTPTSIASATLLVGATLTGDDNAVPGVFNGSFDVTVAYQ